MTQATRCGPADHGLVAARRFVPAPVGLVWSVFVDFGAWGDWTDTMRVWSQGPTGLEIGSELTFEAELGAATVLNRAVIRDLSPPLRFVWSVDSSGRGHGFHSESTWTFTPTVPRSSDGFALGLPAGTRIVSLRTLEAEHARTPRTEVLADTRRLVDRLLADLESESVRRSETGTVGTHGPALA